jgi:hypothetical protein
MPARGRMHDHAGRLVDDEQVLIFVDRIEHHRLGSERAALGRRHEHDLDALTGADLARCGARSRSIQRHMALRDQRLQVTARKLRRHLHDRLVEALAVQRRGGDCGTALRRCIPWLGSRLLLVGVGVGGGV